MSNIFKIYYNFNNANKFIYIFCKTFLEINSLSLDFVDFTLPLFGKANPN